MKKQPTDIELKQILAKMLPNKLKVIYKHFNNKPKEFAALKLSSGDEVKETELLAICWELEETLVLKEQIDYEIELGLLTNCHPSLTTLSFDRLHASWQHRTMALVEVKNKFAVGNIVNPSRIGISANL